MGIKKIAAAIVVFSVALSGCGTNSIRVMGNLLPIHYKAGKVCNNSKENVEKLERNLAGNSCVESLVKKYPLEGLESDLKGVVATKPTIESALAAFKIRSDKWCAFNRQEKFEYGTEEFESELAFKDKWGFLSKEFMPKQKDALNAVGNKYKKHYSYMKASNHPQAEEFLNDYLSCLDDKPKVITSKHTKEKAAVKGSLGKAQVIVDQSSLKIRKTKPSGTVELYSTPCITHKGFIGYVKTEIPNDTEVEVRDVKHVWNGRHGTYWYKVMYNRKFGWVSGQDFVGSPEPTYDRNKSAMGCNYRGP